MAVKLIRPDEKTHERENYTLAVTQPSHPEKIIGYIFLNGINETRGEYRDIGFSISLKKINPGRDHLYACRKRNP